MTTPMEKSLEDIYEKAVRIREIPKVTPWKSVFSTEECHLFGLEAVAAFAHKETLREVQTIIGEANWAESTIEKVMNFITSELSKITYTNCSGIGTIPAPVPRLEISHDTAKDALLKAILEQREAKLGLAVQAAVIGRELASAEKYIANLVLAATVESPGMDTTKLPAWVMRKAVPYHDAVKESLAEALSQSNKALDDWSRMHAPDCYEPSSVEESERRIQEGGGTLYYIASRLEENRKVLAAYDVERSNP